MTRSIKLFSVAAFLATLVIGPATAQDNNVTCDNVVKSQWAQCVIKRSQEQTSQ